MSNFRNSPAERTMAKSGDVEQLILEALERALSDPSPRKLHGTKSAPGVFLATTAATKAAAIRCLEQGFVRQVGEERAGKKVVPVFAITSAGVSYVLDRSPAPQLLAAMLKASDRMAQSVAECDQTLRALSTQAQELRSSIAHAAARLHPPDVAKILKQSSAAAAETASNSSGNLIDDLAAYIRTRRNESPLKPVALPELFRFATARCTGLTVGQFHDVVRQLACQQRLRLLPYTQAMYQLPEPEYALIVGREIMYYAEPGTQ